MNLSIRRINEPFADLAGFFVAKGVDLSSVQWICPFFEFASFFVNLPFHQISGVFTDLAVSLLPKEQTFH